MRKFKVYLLDFDGTLIDSYDGLSIFYNAIFNEIGCTVSKEEEYEFSKISLQEAFKRKCDDPSKLDRFTKKCFEMVDSKVLLVHNKTFKDTIPFINYLIDNKITNAIVTGNDIKHAEMVFDNLNIPTFYNAFISSKDLTYQKPHPEGILLALKKLGYQGDLKEVCYVGDAWNDFLAAREAGVTPILVNRFNEYQPSEEYILINNLSELY